MTTKRNLIDSQDVYVILHGSSSGIDSELMSLVFEAVVTTNNSVLAFNLPFIDAGTDSSDDLSVEVASLDKVIKCLKTLGYKKFHFIGKSLGAIVAAFWAEKNLDNCDEIIALGLVSEHFKNNDVNKKISLVIHGENDPYSTLADIKKTVPKSAMIQIIEGGDHSFWLGKNNANKKVANILKKFIKN